MSYEDSFLYTSDLESKLDLRPIGGYEESLETINSLLDDEYDTVEDVATEMHPRVSHEIFRYSQTYDHKQALLETTRIETVQDILEENSKKKSWWGEEILFDLGYRQMPKSPDLRKLNERPYANHVSDNIHIPKQPFITPYGRGKEKRESDEHYLWANNFLILNMANQEIIIE